jgi:hypothetical protein
LGPFRSCCEIVGASGRIDLPTLFGGDRVVVTAGGEERVAALGRPPADDGRLWMAASQSYIAA